MIRDDLNGLSFDKPMRSVDDYSHTVSQGPTNQRSFSVGVDNLDDASQCSFPVFVGDQQRGLDTPVPDGAEVLVVTAVAGG